MQTPTHLPNWYAGWGLLIAAFASGAVIGLFFHRPGWLGGYDSFPRRLLRLGHIAMAALGMVNVLYSLSPWPHPEKLEAAVANSGWIVGGISMPAVCWLTAWKRWGHWLFGIPVTALISAAVWTLRGAGP
jgi:hypothetical protein